MSEPRIIDLPPLSIRAAVAPKSIDEEARTVDLTFSTGAAVKRFDWDRGEYYLEKLSLDPKSVRLERLNNGAPLLNTHSGWSLGDQLGVVEEGSAEISGKKGIATVRFSRRDDVEPFWLDVKDRIIRNVSVGYIVHEYEETTKKGELPVRTAIDWEPYEISLVPMPADAGAQTRDGKKPQIETHQCRITVRGAEPTDDSKKQNKEPSMDPITQERQPSETLAEPNPLDPGAPLVPRLALVPTEPTDADRGADVERERISGIITGCRAVKVTHEFMERLIKDKTPLVQAQALMLGELAKRGGDNAAGPQVGTRVQMGDDALVHVRGGIENALLHRISPQLFKLEDIGRNYRGMTLLDVGRTFLNAQGVRTTGFSKLELAGAAMGINTRGGYHTTSDFSILLENVVSKTLRRAYEESPQTFKLIARQVTLPDFKVVNRNQLGEAPALLEVKEHGEFTRGTIGEAREQFQLKTYGRVFAITRQAIVNDDTDAFSRVPMLFGRSARNLESDLVWEQITSNPTMGDGIALFHASHGNLASDGDPISIATLSAARAALRSQSGLDASTKLNLTAKFLIVPPSLETVADQFVSTNLLGQLTGLDFNPFAGRLQVLAEPRLEANSALAWYVAASADQIDMLEYAYLEGEAGPTVETRVGFDVDGLEIKARHDFAAKVIDWRGFYKNDGEIPS